MCLDDDLRCKFERYQTYNIEHKGRMLQIETQKRIYWNAMENAFMLTNMPILYVKFGFELMEDFIDMIRSGVFEQTEGTLSVPRDLVKEFILDTFEALEASGEMNRLRCEEQIKDYEGELPTAKVN